MNKERGRRRKKGREIRMRGKEEGKEGGKIRRKGEEQGEEETEKGEVEEGEEVRDTKDGKR